MLSLLSDGVLSISSQLICARRHPLRLICARPPLRQPPTDLPVTASSPIDLCSKAPLRRPLILPAGCCSPTSREETRIAKTEQGIAQTTIRCIIDFNRDPWPKVSDNAKDLVQWMLDPDPTTRLTAQQVIDHPWLQNAKKAPDVFLGEIVRARLKQFSVMNKYKKKALRVVAEHLFMEEVARIKEMFQMMDINNNGKIALDELKLGLNKLEQQIPDPDVQILIDAILTRQGLGVLPW